MKNPRISDSRHSKEQPCRWLTLVVRFYLYAPLVRLAVKSPGCSLRKTSNLFLFNCEPGRIDHGDLKDSNFEDDRQPEIAIWPPKPEVLISQKVRQISWNLKFQQQTRDKTSSKRLSLGDSNGAFTLCNRLAQPVVTTGWHNRLVDRLHITAGCTTAVVQPERHAHANPTMTCSIVAIAVKWSVFTVKPYRWHL